MQNWGFSVFLTSIPNLSMDKMGLNGIKFEEKKNITVSSLKNPFLVETQ